MKFVKGVKVYVESIATDVRYILKITPNIVYEFDVFVAM